MDFSGWIPVTPAKPIPTRPQPNSGERQGNQPNGTNLREQIKFPTEMFHEAPAVSNGAAACLDSISLIAQNSGLSNWETALGGKIPGSQSLKNAAVGWNNIPFADLLALADAACPPSEMQRTGKNAASSPFFPFPYSPIDRNLQQPRAPTTLPMNQNYTISSMQTNNNSKWPPQISQYGFPIPYRPTYDLNSPRKIADADSNGAIFQFAPVTPDHGRKVQGIQHPEVANILLDGSPCQENNKLQNAIPDRNNAFEQHREESKLKQVIDPSSDAAPELLLQQVVDSSPAALSTPSKENNQLETAQENGIDLNKTPAQKTRRKKHRPRVVIEGKPKRGPKTTVKPAVTDETPRKKRKYVRRNGIHASETPSADVGEITDTTPHSAVKSCKRALNFDYEEQTRIGSHGTTLNHHEGLPQSGLGISSSRQDLNCNPEPRAQDFTKEINGCTGIKSSVQLAKGLEVIVENSPAGIAFDLNRSLTQMLDEYISLPETQQTTRKDQQLEDCEVLTRNIHSTVTSGACKNSREKNGCHSVQDIHTDEIRNSSFPKESAHSHENDVPSTLQSDQHARPQSQNKKNDPLHILVGDGKQATGSKRGHSHTSDVAHLQSMNLTGTHVNPVHFNQIFQSNEYQRSSYPGLLFPEICKKRRTEKSQANIKVRAPSSVLAMVNDEISNQFMSNFNNRGSTPKYGSTKNTENLRNGVSSSIHNAYSQSMGMVCSTERIPDKIPPQKEAPRNANTDKSQVSEFLLTSFGQVERNTKKRSKGPTRVRDFKSLAAILHCNALPLTAPKAAPTSGGQGIEIFHRTQKCIESLTVNKQARMAKEQNNKETAIVNSLSYSDINQLRWREHQVAAYGYCQPLAISRGQIEVAQQFNSPIEELAQKMNHLSFKDVNNKISVEKQNALVPYNHGQMVPYEGLFDPAKKRRPRPKVDLDPETDRVWKLLMGKEASEERDTNKEKWWAEERRIFSGRVDSFIARMHLIQGDRRFSQWNGSVVDSVIGVFLTQNVSDHLSSSAFMSLAARFPLKSTSNNTRCNVERTSIIVEEPEMLIIDRDDAEWQDKTSKGPVSDQGSVTFHEAEYMKDNKTGDSKESCGITEGGCWEGISKMRHESPVNTVALDGGKEYQMSTVANRGVQEELVSSQSSEVLSKQCETPERTTNVMKEIGSLAEPDDGRTLDDVVSSQNSVDSCVPQTDELVKSCSDSNSEEEDPTTRNSFNASFVELLQMARTNMLQQYSSQRSGNLTLNSTSECGLNQPETVESNKRPNINQIDAEKDPFSIFPPHSQFPNTPVPVIRSSNYYLHFTADSRVLEVDCPEIMGVGGKYLLSSTTESAGIQDGDNVRGSVSPIEETRSDITARQKVPSNTMVTPGAKQCPLENKEPVPPLISTGRGFFEKNPLSCSKLQGESNKTFQSKGNPATEPGYSVDTLAQSSSSVIQKGCSDEPNSSGESICVVETLLVDKQKQIDRKMVESTLKEQVYDSYRESSGTAPTSLKAKGKLEKEKKKAFDWDSLRKEVICNGVKRERTKDRMDSIDWEAVRCADVNEIAKAIKERGMNNMLAERIKDFLNRLVRDHGSIDLEWLRDIPPDKTKEYLLSVRGLGLKSVECVRLLTLHHLAFPVDTNVGRIAVRLGWVPLQPLPESLQLHLLELYPVLETIQKYLWPRLCTLDQRTLYELHYQMITFGKVFCTKSKPNCNACPLRAECKHFASAFASARLALPGPEQKGIVSSTVPFHTSHSSCASINSRPLLLPELNVLTELVSGTNKHEPIIEEPATPESHCRYITESDIEDAFYDDPDEIPTIKLNIEDFATNLQSYMQENMELQEGDMSKALVALTPEAASIPTPKLKNVTRLRTEHQVYELPDSHPLLQGVEKRVPGDVCSYLLAIWTPGETAESIQPPEGCCSSQASGNLCNETTCFSCNSIREANSQTVRGTLLIPCKTAMRGSFPLNGTYFQVNEVFADHESSLNPIDVPRNMLWNLPRRTVYFGTSIPTIFKGQTTEEIQSCFWRGYVCVRGFDQKTRAPRPLMARLHFPASRLIRTKTKASQE